MKWFVVFGLAFAFIGLALADGEIWEEDDHEVLIRNERGTKSTGKSKSFCFIFSFIYVTYRTLHQNARRNNKLNKKKMLVFFDLIKLCLTLFDAVFGNVMLLKQWICYWGKMDSFVIIFSIIKTILPSWLSLL